MCRSKSSFNPLTTIPLPDTRNCVCICSCTRKGAEEEAEGLEREVGGGLEWQDCARSRMITFGAVVALLQRRAYGVIPLCTLPPTTAISWRADNHDHRLPPSWLIFYHHLGWSWLRTHVVVVWTMPSTFPPPLLPVFTYTYKLYISNCIYHYMLFGWKFLSTWLSDSKDHAIKCCYRTSNRQFTLRYHHILSYHELLNTEKAVSTI